MGPGEALVAVSGIIAVFGVMPFIVFRGILAVVREKKRQHLEAGQVGLSELQEHIARAVERANMPLVAQVQRIEQRVSQLEQGSAVPVAPVQAMPLHSEAPELDLDPDVLFPRDKSLGRSRSHG